MHTRHGFSVSGSMGMFPARWETTARQQSAIAIADRMVFCSSRHHRCCDLLACITFSQLYFVFTARRPEPKPPHLCAWLSANVGSVPCVFANVVSHRLPKRQSGQVRVGKKKPAQSMLVSCQLGRWCYSSGVASHCTNSCHHGPGSQYPTKQLPNQVKPNQHPGTTLLDLPWSALSEEKNVPSFVSFHKYRFNTVQPPPI